MNTYNLVLKRETSKGSVPILSFEIHAQNNTQALLDGQQCVLPVLESEGYELIDCGMWIGADITERDMTFVKNDEEYYFTLNIIK